VSGVYGDANGRSRNGISPLFHRNRIVAVVGLFERPDAGPRSRFGGIKRGNYRPSIFKQINDKPANLKMEVIALIPLYKAGAARLGAGNI